MRIYEVRLKVNGKASVYLNSKQQQQTAWPSPVLLCHASVLLGQELPDAQGVVSRCIKAASHKKSTCNAPCIRPRTAPYWNLLN